MDSALPWAGWGLSGEVLQRLLLYRTPRRQREYSMSLWSGCRARRRRSSSRTSGTIAPTTTCIARRTSRELARESPACATDLCGPRRMTTCRRMSTVRCSARPITPRPPSIMTIFYTGERPGAHRTMDTSARSPSSSRRNLLTTQISRCSKQGCFQCFFHSSWYLKPNFMKTTHSLSHLKLSKHRNLFNFLYKSNFIPTLKIKINLLSLYTPKSYQKLTEFANFSVSSWHIDHSTMTKNRRNGSTLFFL